MFHLACTGALALHSISTAPVAITTPARVTDGACRIAGIPNPPPAVAEPRPRDDGGPHRLVLRFVVVRRGDGSGGLDETLLDRFMRDLNYGFRDVDFDFVRLPQVLYIDDDALYADIPDWGTATALLQAHQEPGVIVNIITPRLLGGPPVTGLNYVANPRGNCLAYERIGQPHSIVFPPHEMAHVFGLFHPYETQFGAECTSGVNCASAGDRVCDTPASPSVHGGNTTATGFFFADLAGPCAGDPSYAPLTDLYMEAGWPAGHILRRRFTDGQIARMHDTLFTWQGDLIGPARPDVLVDCDGDGVDDLEQIAAGAAPDINRDLVPDGCEVLPRARDLLVSCMTDDVRNRVRFFDGTTGDFRDTMWNGMTWAHQLREGPDGLVYLARLTIIQRLDVATGRTRDNFIDGVLEGAGTFVDLLFDQNDDVLVLDNASSNIRRYSGASGSFMGVYCNLGAAGMTAPKYMEYGPDGNIYVAGNGALGNTVQRVKWQTGAVLGSFVEPGAGGLAAGQGLVFHDGMLYVSNGGAHNVLRYDAATGAFAGEFVASGSGGLQNPHSLRFGPDGHLYVASRGTNSVKRYDGASGDFIDDFVEPAVDGLSNPAGLYFVPVACGADISDDGQVGVADLLVLLAAWGAGGPADLDEDGHVGVADLLILLAAWGPCV